MRLPGPHDPNHRRGLIISVAAAMIAAALILR
jgi:hypothetical protein